MQAGLRTLVSSSELLSTFCTIFFWTLGRTGFFLVYSRLQVQTLLINKCLLDDFTEALIVKNKDCEVFL